MIIHVNTVEQQIDMESFQPLLSNGMKKKVDMFFNLHSFSNKS